MKEMPLVSILTPVYNGEKYIAECIESVIGQTYQNLEYIIVNNCSRDSTLQIALHYANIDSRIRVINNQKFVGIIENHNIAFKLISPKSVYCKVVSADDWITPDYLHEMVRFAENYPNVGIVGCYQQVGSNQQSVCHIKWKMPNESDVISGRELCRIDLMEGGEIFGAPTSLLYRSDMVMKCEKFYPHPLPYADTSACYEQLQKWDFGFVHKNLSFQRIHDQQISESTRNLGKSEVAIIQILLEYEPIYLNAKEFEMRKKEVFEKYYKWLGGSILKMRNKEFWAYHSSGLKNLGYPLNWAKVIKYAIVKTFQESKNPKKALEKISIYWR